MKSVAVSKILKNNLKAIHNYIASIIRNIFAVSKILKNNLKAIHNLLFVLSLRG